MMIHIKKFLQCDFFWKVQKKNFIITLMHLFDLKIKEPLSLGEINGFLKSKLPFYKHKDVNEQREKSIKNRQQIVA